MYNNIQGRVINKELQVLDHFETTYNFEVEDNHNYYVGVECILVHNDCDGSNVVDVQECSKGKVPNANSLGQKHHAIGRKPFRLLEKTPWGKNLNRNDYLMKALTVDGHKGYQKWHRTLDEEIIKAVKSSRNLSLFQKSLNEIYGHLDIILIFGHVNIKL